MGSNNLRGFRGQRAATTLTTSLADPVAAQHLIRACGLDAQGGTTAGSDEWAMEEIARWVAAPFFIGFTSWVLTSAAAMGIDRLYFLARDGHLPWLVAQRLVPRDNRPALTYLFVSRRACSLASTARLTTEDVLWLVGNSYRLGPSDMIERLELRSEEAWACFADDERARPLDVDETVRIAERIATGPAGAQILERARGLRPSVTGYLESTGFLDDGAVGLVDLGGVGSHIRALANLREEAAGPVIGFLASRSPLPATITQHRSQTAPSVGSVDPTIYTYFADAEAGAGPLSSGGAALLQTFCATGHGTVQGYRAEGASFVPALDEHQASRREVWDVQRVHATVLQTVTALAATDAVQHLHDLRTAALDLVEDLADQPTLAEARAWGSHPMESTSPHIVAQAPFARPYGWRDIPRVLRARSLPGGWTRWQAGSIRLSPPVLRQLLRVLLTVRRRARRLRAHLSEREPLSQVLRRVTTATPSTPGPILPVRGIAIGARDAVRLRHQLRRSRVLRTTWPGQLRRSRIKRTAPTHLFLDVFDTVLTRSVLPPNAVDRHLARAIDAAGVVGIPGREIVDARRTLARSLRREHRPEPCLDRIYGALADILEVPKGVAMQLRALELDTERHVSRAVPSMVTDLESARSAYQSVTFVSDMYLPSPFIRSLLQQHGLWHAGDEIWVSAEAGADKRSGELFRAIEHTKGVRPEDCLHVGNDAVGDSAAPRWMGWHVAPYTVGNATPAERSLVGQRETDGSVDGDIAGALRLVRLAMGPQASPSERTIERACPVLAAYVNWLLSACPAGSTLWVPEALRYLISLLVERDPEPVAHLEVLDGFEPALATPQDVIVVWRCGDRAVGLEETPVVALRCTGEATCHCRAYLPLEPEDGRRWAVLDELITAVNEILGADSGDGRAALSAEPLLRRFFEDLHQASPEETHRRRSVPAATISRYLDALADDRPVKPRRRSASRW